MANLKAMGIRKNHGDPEALFIEAGRVLDTEWIRGEVAKLARDKDVEMVGKQGILTTLISTRGLLKLITCYVKIC